MSEVLVSWKEIAAYVRVSVSTAQRYHRMYAMPVCTTVGRRVRTSTALIDRWFNHLDQMDRETRYELERQRRRA